LLCKLTLLNDEAIVLCMFLLLFIVLYFLMWTPLSNQHSNLQIIIT
jgi:preprotein translocase subunit YajC